MHPVFYVRREFKFARMNAQRSATPAYTSGGTKQLARCVLTANFRGGGGNGKRRRAFIFSEYYFLDFHCFRLSRRGSQAINVFFVDVPSLQQICAENLTTLPPAFSLLFRRHGGRVVFYTTLPPAFSLLFRLHGGRVAWDATLPPALFSLSR